MPAQRVAKRIGALGQHTKWRKKRSSLIMPVSRACSSVTVPP